MVAFDCKRNDHTDEPAPIQHEMCPVKLDVNRCLSFGTGSLDWFVFFSSSKYLHVLKPGGIYNDKVSTKSKFRENVRIHCIWKANKNTFQYYISTVFF